MLDAFLFFQLTGLISNAGLAVCCLVLAFWVSRDNIMMVREGNHNFTLWWPVPLLVWAAMGFTYVFLGLFNDIFAGAQP